MSGFRHIRQARRVSDGVSAGRLAAMRDRAVVLAAAEAQASAADAAADAAAADGRVDDVLSGAEVFTGLSIDGGEDVKSFLEKVASDVLPTAGLAANAVTDDEVFYDATVLALNGTTPVTLGSVGVTTGGEPVDISCRFLLEVQNFTAFGLVFRIWRDNGVAPMVIFTELLGGQAFKDAGGDYRFGQPYTAEWTDQPAAGTYDYFMEAEFTINTGFGIQEVSNRRLQALRRKR